MVNLLGRFSVRVSLAATALLVLLLQTTPLTYWEYDELLFGAGVARFDPLVHHPHPPGYPVFVGLGKAFNFVTGDPFAALVALSIVSTIVGFVALAFAFRNLLKDEWLGLAAAALFYLSPGMLVHATVALSDATAVGLLALAVYRASKLRAGFSRRDALWFGVTASLAIGCRPQLAVIALCFMAFVLLVDRSRPRAAAVVASFAATSLVWLLPLVFATGGVSGFLRYEFGQAVYFVAHDADLARADWTASVLAFRFLAHPWGQKLVSFPVVGLAAVGLFGVVRRKDVVMAPLVVSGGLYLALAAITMDPRDGVRYALPGTMVVALLAASGLGWTLNWLFRSASNRVGSRAAGLRLAIVVLLTVAVTAGSVFYVAPVIRQRHLVPSPPAQAAVWAREHLPSNAAVLFELAMRPHAEALFSQFHLVRMTEEALDEYAGRVEVPVFVLVNDWRAAPDATVFSWNDSDAYGKLTRNYYRVVSLVPVPPARRYRAVRGLHRLERERTVDGRSWRWMSSSAELWLPDLGAKTVTIRLGLGAEQVRESNVVKVSVNGKAAAEVTVRSGETTDVTLDLPPGAPTLAFVSAKSLVPALQPGSSMRDTRDLGVMLLGLEQHR